MSSPVSEIPIAPPRRAWRATPGAVAPLDAITAQLDCIIGDSPDRRQRWEAERMGRFLCSSCGNVPANPGSHRCRGCVEIHRVRMIKRRRIVSARRRDRNRALREAARRVLLAFERGSVFEVESRMDEMKKVLKNLEAA